MLPYQIEFINLARQYDVLKFGEFTLKSGRVSPYFFNAGGFDDGRSLGELAGCYADAIMAAEGLVRASPDPSVGTSMISPQNGHHSDSGSSELAR